MSHAVAYTKIALKGLGYCSAQIEPTSQCFQSCPSCSAKKCEAPAFIAAHALRNLLSELRSFRSFEHVTFTGGDPQAYRFMDEIIDFWERVQERSFSISASTAMMLEPNKTPWIRKINHLRLSLDAASAGVYYRTRGVRRDPEEAVEFARYAGIPWSALTCLSTDNMHEIKDILNLLIEKGGPLLQRWSVVPMIGASEEESVEILGAYQELEDYVEVHRKRTKASFGFGFNTAALKNFYDRRSSVLYPHPPCWISRVSCHIKANGDVYPCCLIGGEATAFQQKYAIGNINNLSISTIYNNYVMRPADELSLACCAECRKVCQFKQDLFNYMAQDAKPYSFRMP